MNAEAVNPIISVSKVVLSFLSSSAASERVFSTSGLIDTHLRSKMNAHTLEKLTVISFFLAKNRNSGFVDEYFKFIETSLRNPVIFFKMHSIILNQKMFLLMKNMLKMLKRK